MLNLFAMHYSVVLIHIWVHNLSIIPNPRFKFYSAYEKKSQCDDTVVKIRTNFLWFYNDRVGFVTKC